MIDEKRIQEALEKKLHFDQGRDGTIENVIYNMDVKTIRKELERLVELELIIEEIKELPPCVGCDMYILKVSSCLRRQTENLLK